MATKQDKTKATKRPKRTPPKAAGRRSRYRGPADDQAASVVAQLGGTNAQIAEALHISERTLGTWLLLHESLRQVVATAKDAFDTDRVQQALLKRALGYDYDEVTRELSGTVDETPDGTAETGVGLIETKRVSKHEPANVTAAIFWLCNRQPDRWRQKQEHQVSISLPEITIQKTYEKTEGAQS